MREKVVDVAFEPRLARLAAQLERRLGEAATKRQVEVASKIGRVARYRQLAARRQSVEEGRAGDVADLLANRHRVHRQAHQPSGGRPDLVSQVRANRSGEQEATGAGIGVHRPANRPEHPGRHLPLVEQRRLRGVAQSGVGIGPERDRFQLTVQPHRRGGAALARSRLAGGARPDFDPSRVCEKPAAALGRPSPSPRAPPLQRLARRHLEQRRPVDVPPHQPAALAPPPQAPPDPRGGVVPQHLPGAECPLAGQGPQR
jgi:hypothetical protein